ncbi:MAG: ketoacyl-ACP synthase III [Clostridiales bacterium]|nr:ketoacyl-ACP synthase III [Clostridiales bacterium]
MTGFKIISAGRAVPSRRITNDDLSKIVDTNDEWIRSRTGIGCRYHCADGEDTLTLAMGAARRALENSGLSKDEIGCVVCATISGRYATPSTACLVQAELELPADTPSLDVNSACSGFVSAVTVASGLLEISGKKYALVIGCEQLSRITDMSDRSTCILFGDGAGALILEKDESVSLGAYMGSDGSTAIVADGVNYPSSSIKMDGKAVFRFATNIIPKCLNETLARAGKTLDEVDWVVFHQANARIIDHCIKKLAAPAEKFYQNIDHTGNTSGASVPMAISEMWDEGLLKEGQSVACVAFGGGLTWAGIVLSVGSKK